MKIKRATFFYNTNLLSRICSGESNYAIMGHCLTDTLSVGDSIKLIGEEMSAIVKVTYIDPKDCNGNCGTGIELLKVVAGELEIEYEIS
jgi:hypothetical protein